MSLSEKTLRILEECDFRVSTDTRKDISGTVFFALEGENFKGADFAQEALNKGALEVVANNALETLQEVANYYRHKFSIPIVAIGGSNGKTTSRELISKVLSIKYKTHSSGGNLNNHIGVPLSILSMPKDTEIGVFELGANHMGEHTGLLNILEPTHVVVTNNGLDHLEGFGSPEGVRKANKEIYDWARGNDAQAFVNKDHQDLVEDSEGTDRTIYPDKELVITNNHPLTITLDNREYRAKLFGSYNLENIYLALSVGESFKIDAEDVLEIISNYAPLLNRSQMLREDGMDIVLDCYNANPTSMMLALDSFIKSAKEPRGVVLGDMLELGEYTLNEHKKVLDYLAKQNLEQVVLIGENFGEALEGKTYNCKWFASSLDARGWFGKQDFRGLTFLLKGSRGVMVEKILNM